MPRTLQFNVMPGRRLQFNRLAGRRTGAALASHRRRARECDGPTGYTGTRSSELCRGSSPELC
eukprot:9432243-Alexandrium_andersonii.AAC.1